MPLIGYTLEGADRMILSGRKTSTIRRTDEEKYLNFLSYQKRGLPIHHYMYPRTKKMKFIAKTPIKSIDLFCFGEDSAGIPYEIARADGFDSPQAMYDWFLEHYGSSLSYMTFMRITWEPPEVVE